MGPSYGAVDGVGAGERKLHRGKGDGGVLGLLSDIPDVVKALLVTFGILACTGAILMLKRPAPISTVPVGTNGCETNIYLIRHGEKNRDGSRGLNENGLVRSRRLPEIFCEGCRFEEPDVLIARSITADSKRPYDTLIPLSNQYQLPIDGKYRYNGELASYILHSVYQRDWCNKVILVCWKHKLLPGLAQALGCPSEECQEWPTDDYETVYHFQYTLHNASDGEHAYWTESFLPTAERLST